MFCTHRSTFVRVVEEVETLSSEAVIEEVAQLRRLHGENQLLFPVIAAVSIGLLLLSGGVGSGKLHEKDPLPVDVDPPLGRVLPRRWDEAQLKGTLALVDVELGIDLHVLSCAKDDHFTSSIKPILVHTLGVGDAP